MVNNTNYRQARPQPQPKRAPVSDCDELLRAIMEASFYALDLQLYLDTHPDDSRALEMFSEACRQTQACKAAFEENFYPLTACASGRNGTWDWFEGFELR